MKRWIAIVMLLLLGACNTGGSGVVEADNLETNFVQTTIRLERTFLYALAGANLHAFLVNPGEEILAHGEADDEEGPEGGTLEGLDGSPFDLGATVVDAAAAREGRFLYFADQAGGRVLAFEVNGATGRLRALPGLTLTQSPARLLSLGERLIALGTRITLLEVDQAGGLTQVSEDNQAATAGLVADDLLLTVDNNSVTSWRIGDNGLTMLGMTPLGAGEHPALLLLDDLLLVVNRTTNVIHRVRVGPNGGLTGLADFALPADQMGPSDLIEFEDRVVVANRDSDNLSLLEVGPLTGDITAEPALESGGSGPIRLIGALDFVYVAHQNDGAVSLLESDEGELEVHEDTFETEPGVGPLVSLDRVESVVVTTPIP